MFKQLLAEVANRYQSVGIGFLWGMAEVFGSNDVPTQSLHLSTALLHLVQAVIETERTSELSAQLWVVTPGSQLYSARDLAPRDLATIELAVAPDKSFVSTAAGALWGLGRTIALEQPRLRTTCIDLQPGNEAAQATILHQELLAGRTNPQPAGQILYRGDVRHVARLARYQSSDRSAATPDEHRNRPTALSGRPMRVLLEDATYLITGGLGALGLQVAQQLVADGAKHLVLTGRGALTTATQRALLAELVRAGADVQIFPANIANADEVKALLDDCVAIAPLRGIIHAAGVLDDGVLTEQTSARFATVFAPKVNGAWHLHTLTAEMTLDFFVCFSSAAALLGAPGQSNYAAANALMDTLMQQRRAMGWPGLSIQWGPWAEVGLAAHLREPMKERQLSMIAPQQGRRLFHYLLTQPALVDAPAQIGVLPFRIAQRSEQPQHQEQGFDQQAYWALSIEERNSTITNQLRAMLAALGGFTIGQFDDQQSLLALGLDSLMTVQLRNQIIQTFALTIPISLFLDGGSIASLATHIVAHLAERTQAETSASHSAVAQQRSPLEQRDSESNNAHNAHNAHNNGNNAREAAPQHLSPPIQEPYQKMEVEI